MDGIQFGSAAKAEYPHVRIRHNTAPWPRMMDLWLPTLRLRGSVVIPALQENNHFLS